MDRSNLKPRLCLIDYVDFEQYSTFNELLYHTALHISSIFAALIISKGENHSFTLMRELSPFFLKYGRLNGSAISWKSLYGKERKVFHEDCLVLYSEPLQTPSLINI